jgi:hypothetical protein
MDQLPSRKPGSDAVRRDPAFSILGLWVVPIGFLSLWLLAGGFTLASLASATGAWRAMAVLTPEPDPVLSAPVPVTPAAAPPAPSSCKLARPRPTRPDRS